MEKLIILYGSQTGNSQDLAERLWKRAKKNSLSAKISSFDTFDLNELNNEKLTMLCVCSTTGQGDVPDNMVKFWKFIMKKTMPAGCLNHIEFGMIGLGDSSYDKYNFIAKKLYKRFIQLGAYPMADLCLCDEQHSEGIEGDYSRWINNAWPLILVKFNQSSNAKSDSNIILKYKIEYLTNDELKTTDSTDLDSDLASESKPFKARLLRNQLATHADHFQNVRFIELDCNTSRISYEAGDVLMLRPSNLKTNVDKFLELFEHLNLDLNKHIRIKSNFTDQIDLTSDHLFESIKTVRDLVEKYFDLNSMPKMSFFETFQEFSTDELEKEKLMEFLTPQGLEDLYNYCYRPRRTIIEVFHDFPKTTRNITSLDELIDLIPSIKPRAFSIASSPFAHGSVIQILVAVVEYKTRLVETRKGTCSFWLSCLDDKQDFEIPIWIKKGSFSFDWRNDTPIIFIGPGTGIAPFRSIINERIHKFTFLNNYLYFGCRNRLKDFYFENEWNYFINKNTLQLHVAFSRDQPEKIYVQDLLLRNSLETYDLLKNKNAIVLIAGNSKRMPQDILAILEKIVKENLSKDSKNLKSNEDLDVEAKEFMKKLETNRRIQMETWN